IPLNPHYDGGLVFVTDPPEPVEVGTMSLLVIGPFDEDLIALRKEWNAWLRENAAALEAIRRRAREDEHRLRQSEIDRLLGPLVAAAQVLGRRENVTVPNLASLMVLLEGDGKSVLLTGDGHWEDVLAGLEHAGRYQPGQPLHVDVLKVPHHGSEHNTHPDFCREVVADHHVFCGHGAHRNPDLDVVDAYIDSRIGSSRALSSHPRTSRPFTLWFTSRHTIETEKPEHRKHMRAVEDLVRRRAARSGGKLRYHFIEGS